MISPTRVRVPYGDQKDLELLKKAASEEGVTVQSEIRTQVLDPLSAMILTGGAILLVGTVAKWIQSTGKCGQIIDIRPGAKDIITRDCDAPHNQILVLLLTDKGETTFKIEVFDPDNDLTAVAKLVFGKLADGVVKPLDTVAQAVKDAIGKKGEVTTTATPAKEPKPTP